MAALVVEGLLAWAGALGGVVVLAVTTGATDKCLMSSAATAVKIARYLLDHLGINPSIAVIASRRLEEETKEGLMIDQGGKMETAEITT